MFQLPFKSLAFNMLTTPDNDSGLNRLQSACIEGDVETVSAILNYSPDKLDSAIAFSLKIGHNATNFACKSIYADLRQRVSEEHKQISESVEKVTKHFQSQSLLHLAAKKGQVEHLRRLLDCGDHVDTPSPDLTELRETPLMLAARFNEEDVVEFLADRGASLTMKDAAGYTALHHAAMGGNSRNVLRLIELGASVSKVNYEQTTALYLAAENGHTEAVRLLLEHGADAKQGNFYGMTPLMLAAQGGHLQVIQLLLKNGGNLSTPDEGGHLPLHYAAMGDQADVVKLILEKSGNAFTKASDGNTLLHLATRLELVQYLVEQGADIHATNSYGRTALHSAAEKGQFDTIKYLLNQGADINSLDASGCPPLFFAVDEGHTAACQVLIESGCELKLRTGDSADNSRDLFELASRKGLTEVLQLLLDRGFSDAVDTVNRCGETPLMNAVRAGHCDTVSFLLDHGADVNGRNASKVISATGNGSDQRDSDCDDIEEDEHVCTKIYGRQNITPLYCALEMGQSEVAKLLIERGADISKSDSENNTLAGLAAKFCTPDVLQLLSDKKELHVDKLKHGRSLLLSAAYREDLNSIPLLVENGVNVNEKNSFGDTTLSCVLQLARSPNSAMEITKLLLKLGADINLKNDKFETPLQIACSVNLDKVAELLLEHGSQPNVKNAHDSYSPLHHAGQNDNANLVKILLQYGADANIKCKDKPTPLHLAASLKSVHTAQVLLEYGVEVEAIDVSGRTPLASAALNGNLRMVRLLFKHGGSVHTKDTFGQTPLMLAVESIYHADTVTDKIAVVKTLLDDGSTVNATDEFGRSPLHYADNATRECFDLLLQYGADVNLPDVNKETPLHFAASAGNTDCIELLLEQGANVRALDRANRTPLHAAAYYEGISVELLIQRGADVHLADKMGWLPLHLAAARGQFHAAEVLIHNGSDANAVDNKGRTVLHLAVRSGRRELIEFLIIHGSDVNAKDNSGRTVLGVINEYSLLHGEWNVFEAYLENGGNTHAVDSVTGRTTLHLAAVSRSVTVLDNLLNEGLDLEARDKNGDTPLHRAAARGTPEMVQRLVDRRADLFAVNKKGQTPFLVSLAAASKERSEILLKHGSNVEVIDKDGNTALHFAVLLPSLLKMIIKKGADVNAANVHGCTPLHRAAFLTGSTGVIKLLLNEGANVHCRDKKGNTPLHIAMISMVSYSDEIASLLIEKGSDVHATNEQGRTCLHMASVFMVKKLILHGVQVNAVDELGCTPLHLATNANDKLLVKVLLQHGSDPEAVDHKGSTPLHVGCCSGGMQAILGLIDQGR